MNTCPHCNSSNTVTDNRLTNPGRTCRDCGKWYPTASASAPDRRLGI